MKRALFLDRDGVINEDRRYPYRPDQIVFVDGIFDLCKRAAQKGYILIVLTNQAGVAWGYFTEEDVEKLHLWMSEQFRKQGINISSFYYCPFHPEGSVEQYRRVSDCRKPEPGMVMKAAADFDIDLSSSVMVGDKPSDRVKVKDLKCVIIKSRYTGDDFDVDNLSQVADLL